MQPKTKISTASAWITGMCAIAAAAIGSLILLHPWSNNSAKHKVLSRIYTVSGTVVNGKTNQSIAQAEISIVGRNEQTTTEQNGNFAITFNDSIISVRLHVNKFGFKSIDQTSIVPNNNLTIQLTKSDD